MQTSYLIAEFWKLQKQAEVEILKIYVTEASEREQVFL